MKWETVYKRFFWLRLTLLVIALILAIIVAYIDFHVMPVISAMQSQVIIKK